MEFKRDNRLDLDAPTPPLGAMELIVSSVASGWQERRRKVFVAIDIKRAYFYAKHHRDTYIELPREYYQRGEESMHHRFRLSLRGAGYAIMKWKFELNDTMIGVGFTRGKTSMCAYRHKALEVIATVHCIALCTGQAELYAPTRRASEIRGVQSVMRGMGSEIETGIHVDASAATGLVMQLGLSGVCHTDTQ